MKKRLDVNDPKVWDKWRKFYYNLSHDENIQFGYDIEAKYPHQVSFNAKLIDQVMPQFPNTRVLEIGGWKGELAAYCFKNHRPRSWHNIDMCKAAVEKTVPELAHREYTATFPDMFDWFCAPRVRPYDLAISCHTIEHLTDKHLVKLIEHLVGIPAVYFEAPIDMERNDWNGYEGTHILEMGWSTINRLFSVYEYTHQKISDWAFLYRKAL